MGTEKEKFKDEFRQRVYKFALDVIGFIEQLPKEQTTRVIGGQLLRSATSIGANVVEAQGAASRKDYTNFFILTFNFWFLNSGGGKKEK